MRVLKGVRIVMRKRRVQRKRDYQKYVIKVGKKIVHGGITTLDLKDREKQHQQKWRRGHIVKIGRRTTEEAARKWEKEHGYT